MIYESTSGRFLRYHDETYRPKSRKCRSEEDADTPVFPRRNYPDYTFRRATILDRICCKYTEPNIKKIRQDTEIMEAIAESGVNEEIIFRMLFR